jgi:hypothetical protein
MNTGVTGGVRCPISAASAAVGASKLTEKLPTAQHAAHQLRVLVWCRAWPPRGPVGLQAAAAEERSKSFVPGSMT